MSPRTRPSCQVCTIVESKYTCSRCMALYCSVQCYRRHIELRCPNKHLSLPAEDVVLDTEVKEAPARAENNFVSLCSHEDQQHTQSAALRSLTSLKWPYIPEESAYPDPLKRDDPKLLQLHHYEAIATSPAIRKSLAAHPRLPALLTSIDILRGPDREHALQRALGVTALDIQEQARGDVEPDEDVLAVRELAEAVEAAVRGGKEGALGLDWRE